LIDDKFLMNHEHEQPRKSQLFESERDAYESRNKGMLDIS
jgi:hypothetical protein